jgi:hypothetical protein
MTNADDLRMTGQIGPKAFKARHDALTLREKLAAARDERTLRAERATELREKRRREVVDGGYFADESIRTESAEVERDLQDFDAAIAELEAKVAEEDDAEKKAAAEAAAAAEAERRAEQKVVCAKASAKLDKALAAAEAAYEAWVESQRDLPVVYQNRRPFYLRAALHKVAPELARVLDVGRVPHSHQRPLAEVTL